MTKRYRPSEPLETLSDLVEQCETRKEVIALVTGFEFALKSIIHHLEGGTGNLAPLADDVKHLLEAAKEEYHDATST